MSLRDPGIRVKAAWVLLILCIIAWPVTSLTLFRSEPQGILGLSWIAIILSMLQIVVATDVRNNQ
jgi:hypothetical protein